METLQPLCVCVCVGVIAHVTARTSTYSVSLWSCPSVLGVCGHASLQHNELYTALLSLSSSSSSPLLECLSYPLSILENLFAHAVALQARLRLIVC